MTGHQGKDGKFQRIPVTERFWNRVDQSGGPEACWPWTGPIEKTGYGRTTDFWKKFSTHRLAYELTNGPIPPGLHVCHKCDNRPCCNPTHLFVGTAKDNMHDMIAKGRKSYASHEGLKGMDNPRVKLTDNDVRTIRATYKQRPSGHPKKGVDYGPSVREIAEQYGVASSLIQRIIKHEVWTHLD